MSDELWAYVVEDDALSLVAIDTLLKELGVRYKRNTTGRDVLEKTRALKPRPDFILLDMDLPQGNSIEIIQQLNSDPTLRDIPVIAIADNYTHGTRADVRRAGFSAFMCKPLPRKQFRELLERVLAGESVWQVPV